ncbi:enoyl-CoA hydratase/isomerase family protein [Thermodesulfobacteriota bacterium]
MAYETIILERSGAIGKLTFNRPKLLNAYNKTVSDEIIQGLNELINDDSVRVIVLTGAGRAFMAGADINMVNSWADLKDLGKIKEALSHMFNPNMMEDCPKPVIAAVNGLAFGMGCEIAMGCDFRIAVESAQFGQPEIKLGIIPGGGGTQRMFHLLGATRALELVCTGDPINAQEAFKIGLINRVVPDDKLLEEVEAFANRLIDKGPIALDIVKKCIYQGGAMSIRDGLDYEVDRFCEILLTEDAMEGTAAFLEKRKPDFKGK